MSLSIGSRLGPYELLAQIGAGGMGQVYRGRDTRLGRNVAVKILPPHRFGVGDFAERFRREARAISSLNHPNICALYDVGETQDEGQTVSYLVMELLEGETLRDRLAAKLTVRQAIDIAVQIASGLAAAHRKGIVHRDLKPENIFLTRDGLVKLVDFGLARESADEDVTAKHLTEPGVVIGTAHYMSPEQVRGDPLDHRSDIFSFGVVLYEMLSGEQPFDAESAVETMAQILHEDPRPLEDFVGDLPPGAGEIVERCLAKEPDERFTSARDLAFSLDAINRGTRPSGIRRMTTSAKQRVARATPASRARIFIIMLLAAALLASIVAGRYVADEESLTPPTMRPLTHSGKDSSPAASPDGRLIAFESSRDGSRRIWLKQIVDGTEVALTNGPDDWAPRFSRDGALVLFTRTTPQGSAIYRVAAVGGEPRKVLDNAFDGDFSPDGSKIAFVRNRVAGKRLATLCIGTPGSAEVLEIATSATDEFVMPRWSPDSRWIVVTRVPRGTNAGSLLLLHPDGTEARQVARRVQHGAMSNGAWTPDSAALVFAELETRGGATRLLRYDLADGTFRELLWNPHGSADSIDLLPNGRVVLVEDVTRQNLREVSIAGRGDSRWLTRGTAVDRQPTYSPDGKRVVFCSDRGGNADLWEFELATGSVHRLTEDRGVDWDPAFLPNGELLWSSNRLGHFEVWTAGADGGSARVVTGDGVDAENPSAPRRGDRIYYDSSHPEKEGLWSILRDGSDAKLVLAGETAHPEISADGQYAVYHRPNGDGGAIVEVVRIEDGAAMPVATNFLGGGDAGRARWLGMTHTIVFVALDDQGRSGLYAQEFVPGTDTASTRRALAGFDRETTVETFAISPDGTRAILSVLEPASGLMIAEGVPGIMPEK
jgi:serine/threonine protein kinase